MVQLIESKERHFEDMDWLKTYWLFSFSSYFDPDNTNFGRLAVFNDDIVMPGKGFGMHSHENMEIITVVLSGEITHEDALGNKAVLRAGDVQLMSAGTGLRHSEHNFGVLPVHFYQIWITPDRKGGIPSYELKRFLQGEYVNRLLPIASGRGHGNVVRISNSDAAVFRCSLEGGKGIIFEAPAPSKIFVYVTSGELFINTKKYLKGDQARIEGETRLELAAKKNGGAEFILVDMPV